MVPILPMHDAQKQIQSGWIGFPRPRGYIGRLIARSTASPYSHVMMFGRIGMLKEINVYEVREFKGARILPLYQWALENSSELDVFRIDPLYVDKFDGEGAVREAQDMIQRTRYNWWQIVRLALRKVPILWHLLATSFDEGASIGNVHAHCSHAVDYWCWKGGGIKPVRNLASHFVDPGMLSRSLLFQKAFTIA